MNRREFITVVGGAMTASPLVARAQTPDRLRRIGVFTGYTADDADDQVRTAAFRQALQELEWIEGRNVHIDYFFAAADADRMRASAAELARLAPDVILSAPSQPVVVLRNATPTIPIVFVNVPDPMALGLASGVAHPGGNLTGFISPEHELAGRWLELLMQALAPTLGVALTPIGVRDEGEIDRAFVIFAREPHGGVVVLPAIFMTAHRTAIAASAERHRLATVYGFRFYATSGGLVSYGPDQTDPYRRAAVYVDRILKGEKPGDLPVQAPTKYELVINLKAAKARGMTIPPSLLTRADEIFE